MKVKVQILGNKPELLYHANIYEQSVISDSRGSQYEDGWTRSTVLTQNHVAGVRTVDREDVASHTWVSNSRI
jgi:hypothetical protein